MRVEFDLEDLPHRFQELQFGFEPLAKSFHMTCEFTLASVKKRVAIFVSKELHCLNKLLWQWQMGELYADITAIVSNHPDAADIAAAAHIPFYHTPVTPDSKAEWNDSKSHLWTSVRMSSCWPGTCKFSLPSLCSTDRTESSTSITVLARVYRQQSVSTGVSPRRQAHWSNRSLRHGGTGRGPNH